MLYTPRFMFPIPEEVFHDNNYDELEEDDIDYSQLSNYDGGDDYDFFDDDDLDEDY